MALPMLKSLSDNYSAVIFGAAGGIGKALTDQLPLDPRCGQIYAGCRHPQDPGATKIRTFAIELARTRGEAVCLGLHPGTVDTHLSLPFQRGVRADALFSPDFAAARLLSVMDGLTADLSGRIFAWDGQEIPP
jgi:hypothetical protein